MNRTVLVAAALAAASSTGCGRAHLNPRQGASCRAAFTAQQVSRPGEWRAAAAGLDSQEADVVARAYLRGLSGKARADAPEPVLYVAPPQRQAPAPLAPSVPKE